MASPSEVRALFEQKLKDGVPDLPNGFNPVDLERVNDDRYLSRIIKTHDGDAKLAADMLWDILVWRSKEKASDINESNIRIDYIKEGAFFPYGRDKDGSLLLIIKSKLHVKGQKDFEELKKCIIYWFDRIEREENGKPITLFMDMDNCGLGNVDMELIKYLIQLMKLYYPRFLNYIIIYQMPWILSAAFKVIKSLLPPKAVERMKFMTKDNLKEMVPQEHILTCWGGSNEYTFEFVPETKSSEHTPKKVTFAETGENQHSLGEMLRINPNDTIIFKTENDEVSSQFVITNMDESAISFKIRTTAPEKFRVRPSSGTLASGASQTVQIVVQSGFQLRTVAKDRFLVLAVHIPKIDMSQKELTEVWQKSSGSKVDEYRLKCHFPEKDLPKNGSLTELKSQDRSDSVTNALNNLQVNYEKLNKSVRYMKLYQFFTLFLTGLAVLLGYMSYQSSMNQEKYCERI